MSSFKQIARGLTVATGVALAPIAAEAAPGYMVAHYEKGKNQIFSSAGAYALRGVDNRGQSFSTDIATRSKNAGDFVCATGDVWVDSIAKRGPSYTTFVEGLGGRPWCRAGVISDNYYLTTLYAKSPHAAYAGIATNHPEAVHKGTESGRYMYVVDAAQLPVSLRPEFCAKYSHIDGGSPAVGCK